MDTALVSELVEGLTAVHSYLVKDLAKDKLSSANQKSRQFFIQRLDHLIKRVTSQQQQSTAPPIGRPTPPITGKSPPIATKSPPITKPPPNPPAVTDDDDGEMYEVPGTTTVPPLNQPSNYTSFLPVTLDDTEPQEDYLAMENNNRDDGIMEETYEEPGAANLQPASVPPKIPPSPKTNLPPAPAIPDQINPDDEPGLYEDPLIHTTPASPPGQPPESGYMDPVHMTDEDKRKSVVPVELIDDWDDAYEKANVKKKEKLKVSKLKNILVKGWLEKLGGRSHKSWQKRYCVLSDMFMYFYEKENSATYNNRIVVLGFVPNPSAELTKPKRNQFAFKLSSTDSSGKSKDYYFRARTEQERTSWINGIRSIFEQGRLQTGRRQAQTLPNNLDSSKATPTSPEIEPEEYEVLPTVDTISEEDEMDEEYMDVSSPKPTPTHAVPNANPSTIDDNLEEEYIDVNPLNDLDGPQEDYVEPEEFRQTLTRQPPSNPSLPLPPRPTPTSAPPTSPPPKNMTSSSSASKLPLPPPPTTSSSQFVTRQPLPALPPARRPDPMVDTSKTYIQTKNGLQYDKIYVILWDFNGIDSDELPKTRRGDLVFVSDPNKSQEWWFGEVLTEDCSKKTGEAGLFPAVYCTAAFELVN